jgi:hypothetical protein
MGWGETVCLVRRPITGLLYQPWMIDDEFGAVVGMTFGKGNRSTRRKPALVPLCSPQIPRDLKSNPGRRCGKPATNRLCCGCFSAWVGALRRAAVPIKEAHQPRVRFLISQLFLNANRPDSLLRQGGSKGKRSALIWGIIFQPGGNSCVQTSLISVEYVKD